MNRPTMDAETLRQLGAKSYGEGKISYYLQAFELEKDADSAIQLSGMYTAGRLYNGGGDYIQHFRTFNPPLSEVMALLGQSNATREQFTKTLKAMLTNLYNSAITNNIDLINSRYFLYLYNDVDELLYEVLPAYRNRISSEIEYAHIELMTIKTLHIVLYKLFTGSVLDRHGTGSYTTGYTAERNSFGDYHITEDREVYSSTTSALNSLGLADKKEEYKLVINQLRAEIRKRDPGYQFMANETNVENNVYFEGFPGPHTITKVNTNLKSILGRVKPIGLMFPKYATIPLIIGIFLLYCQSAGIMDFSDQPFWNMLFIYGICFIPMPIGLAVFWHHWRKAVKYTQQIQISNRL